MDLTATLLLTALLGVLALWGLSMVRRWREPELALPSTVVETWTQLRDGAGWESGTLYFARFRSDSGEEQVLALPEAVHATLTEGATGTLRVRGDWFRGFTPQRGAS